MITAGKLLKTGLMLSYGLILSSLTMGQQVSYYEEKTFEVGMYPAADAEKLWVNIERRTMVGQVQIAIYDAKGQEVFSEWLPKRESRFHQRFDLSAMSDGTYTFVINDGNQTQERTFRLATPGLREQLPKRLITLR